MVPWLPVILALLFAAGSSLADDTPAKPDSLTPTRTLIAQRQWAAAATELKRVNETGSADWNNLMGYVARKSDPPDLAAADKFYNEALRIDPKHRGALEYSGELYLMTGQLPKAEARLATLDKLCFLPCEAYTDLKKAIALYKQAGNRYVPVR